MKIVIFGTGKILEKYKEHVDFETISCFIDNDRAKQNSLIYGKRILSPESLCEMIFLIYQFLKHDQNQNVKETEYR